MNALRVAIQQYRPRVVIETGTYLGKGSTRMITEAFAPGAPEKFYTIEISRRFYEAARRNLLPLGFVEVLWGLSVGRVQAEEFLQSDSLLWEAGRYGIEVEQPEDPVGFYLREISSDRNGAREDECYPDPVGTAPDNLLARLLAQYKDRMPLIALDSAGGVGWLEFQEVLHLQEGLPFVLFLDDVNHVKHYRSLKYVQSSPEFRMIDCDVQDGWALAAYESGTDAGDGRA
jgi:hypothetical protein